MPDLVSSHPGTGIAPSIDPRHRALYGFFMRPKLAVVSPLPPTQNGIADFTAELLPYHQADFTTFGIIGDDQAAPDLKGAPVTVLRASEVLRDRTLDDAHFIYHIGNNPDHAYALPLLARRPGLVVLHDYGLGYLLETSSFPLGDRETYRAWAQHDHGRFGDRLAARFLTRGLRGRFMSSTLALNGPVLARASALVVHSRYSQFKAASRRPGLPVHYMPHHVSPRVAEARRVTRSEARSRLGLPQDAVLVTALGFITRPKLIDRVLKSLARLQDTLPDFRFVLAGERRIHEYNVDADIRNSGLGDRIVVTDYLSEDDFFLHLAATDLIVNLRHPTGGESSGTLTRAMGFGRPCIVLDHGPIGEMPDHSVAKVRFGPDLERDLDAILGGLIRSPARREALAAEARALAETWTARASAQRYHDILAATPRLRPARTGSSPVVLGRRVARVARGLAGGERTVLDASSDWWRYSAAPVWDPDRRPRLLCIDPEGSAPRLLSSLFGWPADAIASASLETVLAGDLGAGTFDALLCILPAEASVTQAETLVRQVSPHLRRGASLTLEYVGHARAAGWKAESLLERMGCGCVRVFTQDEMMPDFERADDAFAQPLRRVVTGIKTSDFTVLAPRQGLEPSRVMRIVPEDGRWMLEEAPTAGPPPPKPRRGLRQRGPSGAIEP